MSQRNVNNLMLVGCIGCFTCIFINGLDARLVSSNVLKAMCQVRVGIYLSLISSLGIEFSSGRSEPG